MSLLRLFGHGFTPNLLDNLEYWYDAADSAQITESGGAVSQWKDKSPNAYHLSQATGAKQPAIGSRTINGRPAIDFNGSSHFLYNSAQPPSDVRSAIWAMHNDINFDETTSSQIPLSTFKGEVTIGFAFGSATGALSDEVVTEFDEDVPGEFVDRQGISNANLADLTIADHILSFVRSSDWFMGVDGSADLRNLTSGGRRDWGFNTYGSGRGMGIGAQLRDNNAPTGGIDRYFDGLIAEIIMFSDELTTAERQAVEGYLAEKWGI